MGKSPRTGGGSRHTEVLTAGPVYSSPDRLDLLRLHQRGSTLVRVSNHCRPCARGDLSQALRSVASSRLSPPSTRLTSSKTSIRCCSCSLPCLELLLPDWQLGRPSLLPGNGLRRRNQRRSRQQAEPLSKAQQVIPSRTLTLRHGRSYSSAQRRDFCLTVWRIARLRSLSIKKGNRSTRPVSSLRMLSGLSPPLSRSARPRRKPIRSEARRRDSIPAESAHSRPIRTRSNRNQKSRRGSGLNDASDTERLNSRAGLR